MTGAPPRPHVGTRVSPSSRRGPAVLQPGGTFSLNERRLSSYSTKASSGEVSPYDNNSPVLSDGLTYPEDSDPFSHSVPALSFTVQSTEGSSRNSPTLCTDKGEDLFRQTL